MRFFAASGIFALCSAMFLHACGSQQPKRVDGPENFAGFDRNEYPGDAALSALHKQFAFTGYWLNNPPGAKENNWTGHRQQIVKAGFGFVVLFNGRLDHEIKSAGMKPDALGRSDAAAAILAAKREGFPGGTVIFIDQEEGGRMLPEQADYLFGWTEAVAGSAYKPGAYVSGQPVIDDPGPGTITSAQDAREKIAARHLHPVALWVAQDACPPAPGCTARPPALSASGTPDAIVWQYAQSPRRKEITQACAATYAADNNCYASGDAKLFIDRNVANSADPSHGR